MTAIDVLATVKGGVLTPAGGTSGLGDGGRIRPTGKDQAAAVAKQSDGRVRGARRHRQISRRRSHMSTIAAALRPIPFPSASMVRRDPAAQAFLLLRVAFTVAPILFGLDKFAG